ncbi:MAG: FxsA family protein [Acidimicrobiales bacterium]
MFGPLLLLFLVVPLVELFLIVQVSQSLGVLETIVLLILVSVIGAWLVRREGLSVMRRVQDQLNAGKMPTNALIDGAMILGGGALMLTPGFLTDAVGISLLLPPIRALLRPIVAKAVKSRVQIISPLGGATGTTAGGGAAGFGRGRGRRGPVYDADSREQSESNDGFEEFPPS